MQTIRTEAILLRRTNYGEADRILSLLTPDNGKVSAIAKGARRPKSKLAGGIELLAVCDLTIMQGRGDLGVVTSSRIKEFYGDILKQYERMDLGYKIIKQVNSATQTVSEPEFFYLLRDSLSTLNDAQIDWQIIELWFRLRLRVLLGHALNLAADRENNKLAADKKYNFDFDEQAFYANERGRFTSDHIKFLRLAGVKNPKIMQQVGGIEHLLGDCLWLTRSLEA